MKTLASIVVIGILASVSAFAQQGQGGAHMEGKGMQGGMMMNQEQMAKIQANMGQMQNLITQIQSEKDPQKRQELMQQHMAMMQSSMHMMGGMMMGGGMMGHGAMVNKDNKNMPAMDMNQRMQIMENQLQMMQNRMQMMQMMMGQMMQHDAIQQQTE